MSTPAPLVSVLMTSYNRENFIGEAIESVLASTFRDFELIICDDCSADNTVAIARSWEQRDPRIRVYINEKNLGDYPNRNRAASYARGEFLMYCDSDDTFYPDGIQRCLDAMSLYPELPFGMTWHHPASGPFVLSSGEALHKHFFEKPFLTIGPGGTIVRRKFFESIGGFPEKYGPANDMYYNLKCPSHAPILMLPFAFVFYRIHDGQEINNSEFRYIYCNYLFLRDALAELDLRLSPREKEWVSRKNKRRFFVNCMNYFLRTRNLGRTRELIRRTNFGIKDLVQAILN